MASDLPDFVGEHAFETENGRTYCMGCINSGNTRTEGDLSVAGDWIESHPGKLGGIPCIFGTRVPVDQIVNLLVDCTDEEIVSCYPTVPVEAVAALRAEGGGQP